MGENQEARDGKGVRIQVPACDACTQGVMDADNPHALGTCTCSCHVAEPVWDDRCCALADPHEGTCVYMCSMCVGAGRTDCFPDDLGCDCGLCDGDGYCVECSGQGFFNEMHEPCHAGWHELAAYGSCDWGGCDHPAERFRWSDRQQTWLPVCADHRAPRVDASGRTYGGGE